ncbi:molybdopterin-containing oxidoreductase family protein [Xiamenia xianingshaonis]|uniref:Molybdopterin-dependent oxidoreductase n=1 Tax=Xiamenia xianingshaonis TaxID=2682776 RepID=A0ABX0IJE6_9ACTN|nr:molybdopterin dinucleotide binding domain-containing protein [Xiamenia xianingshaonis]NHM13575.1 molybdopterin-dependent oxidoreductase [Xiamenia xianingshaonis]
MSIKPVTRRSFLKIAAAAAATTATVASGASLAFAEDKSADAGEARDVKRVRTCCRGCGKMECGVWVTVENGRATKVEGDTSCFTSGGNCCAKSQSSLQAAYHPDRVLYPMKRTNPKDAPDPGWVRITWDEAYSTMAENYQELIDKYGGETIMMMSGTSRCWCMGAYGVFPLLFQSPNRVTPYQVCKGPRHFATLMQSSYAFSWQATVDKPRVMVRWGGSTEMSNYDDSCRMTVDSAKEADAFITVDPRLSNLGRESTIWQHLYPQTDGALALSWIHVVIENKLYDELFVKRWTDAPFLVCEEMGPTPGPMGAKMQAGFFQTMTRLVCESDLKEDGSPFRLMCWDAKNGRLTYFDAETMLWEGENWSMERNLKTAKPATQENLFPGVAQGLVPAQLGFGKEDGFEVEIDPAIEGEYEVTLKDGKAYKVKPVWEHLKARAAEYAPDIAEGITGIPADQIELAAKTYATRVDPESGYGNGGIGYMLATEHGCNAIQNSRALDTLVGITGNWDTPAGNRGGTTSFLRTIDVNFGGNVNMGGMPDLTEEHYKKLSGIEKFPVLNWWQYWADANSVYEQIQTGDPYPIRGGIAQSGDFMNMGNSLYNFESMRSLDFLAVIDFWHTPLSDVADLLLPCAHWIEANGTRPSQGSSGGMGLNVQCVERPGEVEYDPVFNIKLHEAMGRPFSDDPKNPYPTEEEYCDWFVRASGMTWKQMVEKFQKDGWWDCKAMTLKSLEGDPEGWLDAGGTWGLYRRYQLGMLRPDKKPGLTTPTGKLEIWSTVMETFYTDETDPLYNADEKYHDDPDYAGVEGHARDILPDWRPAPLGRAAAPEMEAEYPFICNTGRRIPVYFHSEHRQLPWCREQWPVPRIEMHPADAEKVGVKQGDWVWIENENGKIRQVVDLYEGIEPGVVNCEHQWWYPELNQMGHGFELSGVNCLVYRDVRDRHSASSYLRAYPVKVYKATPENSPFNNPVPCGEDGKEIITAGNDPRLKEWAVLNYGEGE